MHFTVLLSVPKYSMSSRLILTDETKRFGIQNTRGKGLTCMTKNSVTDWYVGFILNGWQLSWTCAEILQNELCPTNNWRERRKTPRHSSCWRSDVVHVVKLIWKTKQKFFFSKIIKYKLGSNRKLKSKLCPWNKTKGLTPH